MTFTTPELDLTAAGSGSYAVTTVSGSQYVLSLDEMTLTRKQNLDDDQSVPLRRDEQPVALLEVVRCTLFEPAVFVIDLNVPGVACTTRQTTEVVAIHQLA